MSNPQVRCGIYTRKSSEEGLEQSFNSLEAQREACLAYIESQTHEGWRAVKDHYDDGGFSGGNMDRPGLQRLLEDISAGKIQIVVVYKVDRLTRSLADFAKIIEIFDSKKASFVSVTQQFNTTTSMGRLTLNVLLSFAQFERELTGERIRDKVAASKKKGMWMGGNIPMGYDAVNRSLVINSADAEVVRLIFRQYLKLGCVARVRSYLERQNILSRRRTRSDGSTTGGVIYSRGAIHQLLKNRLYVGEVHHRGQYYPGQHQAIVTRELWDQVAAKLETNTRTTRRARPRLTSALLTGIIWDISGVRFTPTHTVKKGKKYRYYTSQAVIQKNGAKPILASLPAWDMEALVIAETLRFLSSPDELCRGIDSSPDCELATQRARLFAKSWVEMQSSEQHAFLRAVLKEVIVGENKVWIAVDRRSLIARMLGRSPKISKNRDLASIEDVKLQIAFRPIQKGNEVHVYSPDASTGGGQGATLVTAIARGRGWYERIVAGEIGAVKRLARVDRASKNYVKRALRCAMLSPQIVDAIISGGLKRKVAMNDFDQPFSVDWQDHERLFS